MKNLLIIYNVIFLLAGNVLLSNIHYLDHHHGHHHDHDLVHHQECYECISFDNNNNCITDFQEVSFSNSFEPIVIEHLVSTDFFIHKKYKSRAPPNS